MSTAVYAGSFDPLTNGHLEIVERASRLFDCVYVVIMVNQAKQTLFSLDERLNHLTQAFANDTSVIVTHSEGLAVDFARTVKADSFVRGIRNTTDYNYEWPIATMNAELAPEIETVFLMARPQHEVISSSIVKEIARYGRSVQQFVPDFVAIDVAQKFGQG
ncbi:pantetheine-phosphate adenylyltransferase [Brochothrix campestris]|uniref:Phosphopantetheine adenylyltransferase n=1 Tax=Brochothrix campestris FSL F6-1037 TaxID=1265861 RepID=W7CQ14_9LIST|nr:pantetheine-phosphate adenylyltransferase [Brochothrix campestris]EUJ41749.1 phosphopantetheine adenylyltransferase [Brochothrix campestris FSL F6-1037]